MDLSEARENFIQPDKDGVIPDQETSEDSSALDLMQALDLLDRFVKHGESLLEMNRDFRIFSNEERAKVLLLCGEAVTFLDQWNMGDLDEDDDDEVE